jgi:hypothetical protein
MLEKQVYFLNREKNLLRIQLDVLESPARCTRCFYIGDRLVACHRHLQSR